MTLGSKTIDGRKVYVFELNESEYSNLIQERQTIRKFVEWSGGRGTFFLEFKKEPCN